MVIIAGLVLVLIVIVIMTLFPLLILIFVLVYTLRLLILAPCEDSYSTANPKPSIPELCVQLLA